MTHREFNHLLSSVKGLSPEQLRQLRQTLDSELAHHRPRAGEQPKKTPAQTPGKGAKRAKPAPVEPKKPLTIEELHQQMMADGLITQLPNPAEDIDDDDPEDQPIVIKGEPLSETIIRERR